MSDITMANKNGTNRTFHGWNCHDHSGWHCHNHHGPWWWTLPQSPWSTLPWWPRSRWQDGQDDEDPACLPSHVWSADRAFATSFLSCSQNSHWEKNDQHFSLGDYWKLFLLFHVPFSDIFDKSKCFNFEVPIDTETNNPISGMIISCSNCSVHCVNISR